MISEFFWIKNKIEPVLYSVRYTIETLLQRGIFLWWIHNTRAACTLFSSREILSHKNFTKDWCTSSLKAFNCQKCFFFTEPKHQNKVYPSNIIHPRGSKKEYNIFWPILNLLTTTAVVLTFVCILVPRVSYKSSLGQISDFFGKKEFQNEHWSFKKRISQ